MALTHKYADYDDIVELIPELPTLTAPSKTQVENWLVKYSDMIDMHLENKGYTTPVTTDTKAIQRLNYHVAVKTAAQARLVAYRSRNSTNEDPQVQVWNREWNEFIKLIDGGLFNVSTQTSDYGDTTGFMKATRSARE